MAAISRPTPENARTDASGSMSGQAISLSCCDVAPGCGSRAGGGPAAPEGAAAPESAATSSAVSASSQRRMRATAPAESSPHGPAAHSLSRKKRSGYDAARMQCHAKLLWLADDGMSVVEGGGH